MIRIGVAARRTLLLFRRPVPWKRSASSPLLSMCLLLFMCPLLFMWMTSRANGQVFSSSQFLLVADSSRDRVVRLADVDASGQIDPAVSGEVIVFYDDDSPGPDLSTPSALTVDSQGRFYLLDGGTLDTVLVLEDENEDDDANDAGEWRVFYENGSAEGPTLYTPNSAVFSASTGALWITDDGRSRGLIVVLSDGNGDGDAVDVGEARVFYDSTLMEQGEELVFSDPEALAVATDGRVFVTDATLQRVVMLVDGNGDGDAMDQGERSVFYDPRGAHPFADPEGLSLALDGSLFVTDEDTGIVLRLRDRDGDGQAVGDSEVSIFVDDTAPFSPTDTNDLLALPDGSVLVLDGKRDQVLRLVDSDGDGTAAGEGEVEAILTPGASVLGTPSGLVLSPPTSAPAPTIFVRGDMNLDARVELTDAVMILAYLFLGDPPPDCLDRADSDDNGEVDITDALNILFYLFLGAPPPPPPYPGTGTDPTPDALSC